MSEFDDDFKPNDDSGGGYGGSSSNNGGGYGGGNNQNSSGGGYKKPYNGGGSGGYTKKEYPPARMPLSVVFYSNKDLPEKAFEKMVTMAKEFNDAGYEIRIPLTWDHAKRFMDTLGRPVLKVGPWKKDFNEMMPDTYANDSSKELVKKIHSNFDSLTDPVKAMVSTAPLSLMGKFSSSPSQYLVLFTSDGAVSKATSSKDTGYASLIIKMAEILNTTVLNLGDSTFNERYDTVRSNIIKPEDY